MRALKNLVMAGLVATGLAGAAFTPPKRKDMDGAVIGFDPLHDLGRSRGQGWGQAPKGKGQAKRAKLKAARKRKAQAQRRNRK